MLHRCWATRDVLWPARILALPTLFVGAMLWALPLSAQNNTQITTSSGAGWRNISGAVGEARATIVAPANHVLVAIEFGERTDAPCFVKPVFWSRVPSGERPRITDSDRRPVADAALRTRSVTADDDLITMCGGSARARRTVTLPHYEDINAGADAIRICTRRSNGRLKGITLFGARLQANGTRRDHGAITDTFDRNNCNEQRPKINCPRGQVITGLRIEHDRASGITSRDPDRRQIVGIAPFCSSVSLSLGR